MVYGLETGAAYMVGAWFKGLANNAMTPEQRASLSPDSEEYRLRVGGSKVQVTGWSLYTLLLWLLKTCMAIFYARLTWVNLDCVMLLRADNKQSGLGQHACSHSYRLRLYCCDLHRYYLLHSLWVSPDAPELADLSRPRQYVLDYF